MLMKFTIHTSQNWAGSVSTAWLITHPICLWCSSGSQSAWCIIHLIILEWLYNHQAIKTRGPEIMGTGLPRTSPSVLMSRRIMVLEGWWEWGLGKHSKWKWKQPADANRYSQLYSYWLYQIGFKTWKYSKEQYNYTLIHHNSVHSNDLVRLYHLVMV